MSSIPQFFVPPAVIRGDTVTLPPDAAHHARNVLRLAPGDPIIAVDGVGGRFACRLTEVSAKNVQATIEERGAATGEARTRITVAQALPKTSGQIEQVLQHGTEVGASGFAFWAAQRSVARLADGEKIEKRLARWRGIVQSSAEQSRRAVLPTVEWLPFAADVAKAVTGYDATLTLHESGSVSLARALADLPSGGGGGGGDGASELRLLVIVGPEGGLTNEEVTRFESAGARTVTLGPRVLRTETAALVALAQILYAREDGESQSDPDANAA